MTVPVERRRYGTVIVGDSLRGGPKSPLMLLAPRDEYVNEMWWVFDLTGDYLALEGRPFFSISFGTTHAWTEVEE